MNAIFKPIRSVHMEMPRPRITIMERSSRDRDKLNKVCRSLFGPVDHDEAQKFLECELKQQTFHESRKWNFDFQKGVPINAEGARYNWQLLDITFAPKRRRSPVDEQQHDISNLYPPSLPAAKRAFLQDNIHKDQRQKMVNVEILKPAPIVLTTETASSATASIRKQTLITDFMQSKKRPFECNANNTTKKLGNDGSTSDDYSLSKPSSPKRVRS